MSEVDREEYLGYVWTPPSWHPSEDSDSPVLDFPDIDDLYAPIPQVGRDTSSTATTEVHEGLSLLPFEASVMEIICLFMSASKQVSIAVRQSPGLQEVWGPSPDRPRLE